MTQINTNPKAPTISGLNSACSSQSISQTSANVGGAAGYALGDIAKKCCGATPLQQQDWQQHIAVLQQQAPAVAQIIFLNVKGALTPNPPKPISFVFTTGAWAANVTIHSDGSRVLNIQIPAGITFPP